MVLAKWLETVCLEIAMKNPADEHAQLLSCFKDNDVFQATVTDCKMLVHTVPLRLRAAVFVNLVAMRRALSCSTNSFLSLTPANLSTLQRANYLFHAAHNSYSVDVCCFCLLHFLFAGFSVYSTS